MSKFFLKREKSARIKPLYQKKATLAGKEPPSKTGEMRSTKNYYPISLLSFLDKLCEKLLVKKFESLCEKRDVLNSKQNGFPEGKSTLNGLVDLAETIRAKVKK